MSTSKCKRVSSSAKGSPLTAAESPIAEAMPSEAGRPSESHALASQTGSASEMWDELSQIAQMLQVSYFSSRSSGLK